MAQPDANLLFGILAVQLKLVTPQQLLSAGAVWTLAQERRLGAILVEQGALSEEQRAHLDALLDSQIAAHDGDAAEVYELYGGDRAAQDSFGGSLVFHPGDDSSGQFASLAAPAQAAAEPLAAASDPAGSGIFVSEQPGRYHLRGEQGRGGIGRVLIAFDESMRREIALKELLPAPAAALPGRGELHPPRPSSTQTVRFLREARITGQLEHPGIVPVYELGQRSDGTVYYTMKLVRGVTLADKLRDCRSLSERMALLPHFLDLCQAIAYAHSRGVTHRDIKPANVMVGEFGETVLLDWGLAKVKGQTDEGAEKLADEVRVLREAGAGESVDGKPIGTPSYMPPEQADGRIAEIDERSDVWSLGAVLYELLTGRPPFSGVTAYEVVGLVLTEEVVPALERSREAPPELAAVAMRCLQREPAGRYPAVEQLAADVSSFMHGGMVSAYTYSPMLVVRRWAARRWPVLATAAVALLLLCGVASYSYAKVLEQRNRALAANQRLDIKNNELLGLKLAAESQDQLAEGQSERACLLALQAAQFYRKSSSWMPDVSRALRDCAGSDNFSRVLRDSPFALDSVVLLPDGRRLAAASRDQHILVWDLEHPGVAPLRLASGTERVAASPDGKWLAAVRADSEHNPGQLSPRQRYALTLWDARDLAAAPRFLEGPLSGLKCIAFSPDGRWVAAGGEDQLARIWDLQQPEAVPRELAGHSQKVMSLAFSPDSRTLASSSADTRLALWDTAAAAPQPRFLTGHSDQVYSLAYAPDGSRLASCSQDGTVRLWDMRDPAAPSRELRIYPAGGILTCVAFSPDGQSLAVSDHDDKLIHLYDMARLTAPPRILRGHSNAIMSLAWSPDSRQLASASLDFSVRLWDLHSQRPEPRLLPRPEGLMSVAIAADGQRIAAGGTKPPLSLWDGESAVRELPGPVDLVRAVALSRDGELLAAGSFDCKVYLWDLTQPASAPRVLFEHPRPVRAVAFSADRHWLASGSQDGPICLFDLTQPDAAPQVRDCPYNPRSLCFSPDGSQLAVSGGYPIGLYSVADFAAPPRELQGHNGLVPAVTFSADGSYLASASWDETVRLWPLAEPDSEVQVLQHEGQLYAVALSPDGRFVATGGKDNTVRLWNMADLSARPELLRGHSGTVTSLAFSGDSRLLVSSSLDATVRVWHVGSEQLAGLVEQLPWRNLSLEEWQTFVGRDVPYQSTLPQLPPGLGAPGAAP